jgi:hypothetical protein
MLFLGWAEISEFALQISRQLQLSGSKSSPDPEALGTVQLGGNCWDALWNGQHLILAFG